MLVVFRVTKNSLESIKTMSIEFCRPENPTARVSMSLTGYSMVLVMFRATENSLASMETMPIVIFDPENLSQGDFRPLKWLGVGKIRSVNNKTHNLRLP